MSRRCIPTVGTRRASAPPPWPVSSALAAVFAGSAAVAVIFVVAGGRRPAVALTVLAVVAAVAAVGTRPAAVPLIAALAWMFANGFIVGHHGVLAWHGGASVWRLAVLGAAAAAGSAIGVAARRGKVAPDPRARRPQEPAVRPMSNSTSTSSRSFSAPKNAE